MKSWLSTFTATVAAAAIVVLIQQGIAMLLPDPEKDYPHVYVFANNDNRMVMYSLKGRGVVTGSFVRSMNTVEIVRNGAHCFEIKPESEDERVPATLSWNNASGTVTSISRPEGITALVCNRKLYGPV